MSDAIEADRKVAGLAPRRSASKTDTAPSEPAPLGRLLRKVRDDEARAGQEPEEPMVNVTISIPKSLRTRARAAFKATSYLENDHSWSHMVSKALESETSRREATHNGGEAYDGGDQRLAPGRKLQD